MSTSRLSGNQKVVADYTSEDEEREPIVEKMKNSLPLSHHKDQDKHKKDQMKDQRDKISSHRRIRKDESSSDESYNRRHKRGSKKHRVHADREDSRRHRVHEDRENCILYDRTETQQDSDSSDNEKRYSRRETQKSRYQSRDRMCSDDDQQDERYEQRRVSRHDYSNIDNNRREIERNMPSNNNDCDKQKEKGRYKDNSDSDGYHKRDVNRFKEYSSDKGDKKYSKRSDRMETSKSKYYENESDHERRSKRSQTHKNYHQQDDSDSHNRSGRQDKQNNDGDYCDRRDIRYMQETGYYSNHEESDYDERRRQIGKNSTELEYDENESSRRKDKHHVHKAKAWSSDDGGNEDNNQNIRKDLKKKKLYQDDGSSRERRKDKRSLQKSGIYQHDSDGHCKINEREQLGKNKHQRKDDAARTDYTIKGSQKGSQQCDSENYYDKRQMEKSRLPDDNSGRNYGRQKSNKKPIQENKDPDDSENINMNCLKDGVKSSQDTRRWDSDQDERDNRRKSQKKHKKNNDEYDRKAEEKHSTSGRNKNEKKKSDITEKEIPSEIVLRKETVKHKDSRDNGRKNKNNESELQNREIEEKENTRSEKIDSNENIKKKQNMDDILTRTGGAYIPPAKLRAMQEKITDKSSINYQRIAWEALKKSINGLINKVNVSNLKIIISELFKENLVRAKGILARSIMQAQAASPTFTHVYAALVAIINSKFPHIGELIIKRLIIQFRRSFRRNDKQVCLACTNFLAHLVNQQTAHEVLALEILTLLLESPTDDSVELAVGFLKECGLRLSEATRSGIDAVFERLRTILHDGEVDKRVQYMIEVMFAVRKDKFKDHPTVIEDLDLVEEEDQFTHLITLEDTIDPEDKLNVFRFDPEYEANEAKYEEIKKAMLESSDSEEENSDEDSNNGNEEEDENEMETQTIIDSTETNLTSLRRTIYLTIQSSLDFEECAHKLLKLELKPGQIVELCYMILDCCAQQRTYEKFFGLLAQRFCQINKIYVEPFEDIFKTAYDTIHRFETNKLRNVARFFAHLFYTDAISWQILSHIKLNEDETTSSSRIFVKILFQELCEYMGLLKLNERVKDPTMQEAFEGLFPRDSPRNTRFAINFFTSIGLGGLTDELREHLKNAPKAVFPSTIPLTANNDDNQNSSEEERSKEDKDSSSSDSSSSEEPRIKKSKRSKRKKRKSKEKKKKEKKSKQSK